MMDWRLACCVATWHERGGLAALVLVCLSYQVLCWVFVCFHLSNACDAFVGTIYVSYRGELFDPEYDHFGADRVEQTNI
jgi:hypothetical protein